MSNGINTFQTKYLRYLSIFILLVLNLILFSSKNIFAQEQISQSSQDTIIKYINENIDSTMDSSTQEQKNDFKRLITQPLFLKEFFKILPLEEKELTLYVVMVLQDAVNLNESLKDKKISPSFSNDISSVINEIVDTGSVKVKFDTNMGRHVAAHFLYGTSGEIIGTIFLRDICADKDYVIHESIHARQAQINPNLILFKREFEAYYIAAFYAGLKYGFDTRITAIGEDFTTSIIISIYDRELSLASKNLTNSQRRIAWIYNYINREIQKKLPETEISLEAMKLAKLTYTNSADSEIEKQRIIYSKTVNKLINVNPLLLIKGELEINFLPKSTPSFATYTTTEDKIRSIEMFYDEEIDMQLVDSQITFELLLRRRVQQRFDNSIDNDIYIAFLEAFHTAIVDENIDNAKKIIDDLFLKYYSEN